MSRLLRLALAACALTVIPACVGAVARVLPSGGAAAFPLTQDISCPSPALGGRLPARVYLPAGYSTASRYPVVYFLHGLPANPGSYLSNPFVASAVAAGSRRAIVVMPQGARSQNSDPEYLDWGPRQNWPRAIASDLTRCVDGRFSTIASRTGRALVGLSAGGYGAANIGLRNLTTFGAVESWSGYFEATDPSGVHILNLGSAGADAAARAPRDLSLKAGLATHPTFLGFYVGQQDKLFLQDNITYAHALGHRHISHLFRVYPGGHAGALWRSQATTWLDYALDALAAGR